MVKHQQGAEAEIARRLEDTPAPGSPNRITLSQLREWAIEYLETNDEEVERFPDLMGQSHWNLWMMDSRSEDALFAVLIFRTDDVEFFCGTGNAYEIKTFAESESSNKADEILTMMAEKFFVPKGSVHLKNQVAKEWLGRGW